MSALEFPKESPRFGAVVLRPFHAADVPMLRNLSTDPYLPQIGSLPGDAGDADALAFIERQFDKLRLGAGYSFCVTDPTNQAVGCAGLWLTAVASGRASIGYAIAPEARGRGFATAAIRALIAFAWSIPEIHRIEAYIEPWNQASQNAARGARLREEGLLRSHQEIDGKRVDMLLFAATRDGERPADSSASPPGQPRRQ